MAPCLVSKEEVWGTPVLPDSENPVLNGWHGPLLYAADKVCGAETVPARGLEAIVATDCSTAVARPRGAEGSCNHKFPERGRWGVVQP
jgi:hypothetical protein